MTIAWELVSSEQQGTVGRRKIVVKKFLMPDGRQTEFQITGDPSNRVVGCVALTSRNTVVLAEQYRPGPERLMMELPGGGVDPGETLEEAAARELAEETGYVAESLTFLGNLVYGAYFGDSRNYFLATGCERRQEQELDPNEFVTAHEVPLAEFVTLAMAGRMTDPGAVLLALPHLMHHEEVRNLLKVLRS